LGSGIEATRLAAVTAARTSCGPVAHPMHAKWAADTYGQRVAQRKAARPGRTGTAVPDETWRKMLEGWHVNPELLIETLNIQRAERKRYEERDAQRTLALQLIDIGYKVLARELHPDKGGSREAMARLNAVRHHLNEAVRAKHEDAA
jgi:hypothetical protein